MSPEWVKLSPFQKRVLTLLMILEKELEVLPNETETEKELITDLHTLSCIITQLITHSLLGTLELFHQSIHITTDNIINAVADKKKVVDLDDLISSFLNMAEGKEPTQSIN